MRQGVVHGLLVVFSILLVSLPGLSKGQKPIPTRTIKLKVVIDENYRRSPAHVFEIKRWVASETNFLEKTSASLYKSIIWNIVIRITLKDLLTILWSTSTRK